MKKSENHWIYKSKPFNPFKDVDRLYHYKGFVYKISHKKSPVWYVGQKHFFTKLGRWTNWRFYLGSSKDMKKFIKEEGVDNFLFEMLVICRSQNALDYFEHHYITKDHRLFTDKNCMNKHSGLRFQKNDQNILDAINLTRY
jgi:hypothetical protein